MRDMDIELQACQLNDYVKRGGTSRLWFQSKGFKKQDKLRIMQASIEKSVNLGVRS